VIVLPILAAAALWAAVAYAIVSQIMRTARQDRDKANAAARQAAAELERICADWHARRFHVERDV
jgi:hypothetical protein